MNILKEFIDKHCHFLYDVYHCEVIDEYITDAFAGDGTITLKYSNLYLCFHNERRFFFVELQSKYDMTKEWYSLDLFRYVILNDENFEAVMDDENVKFLNENLKKIDELLSESKLMSTIQVLDEATTLRVKKIFG